MFYLYAHHGKQGALVAKSDDAHDLVENMLTQRMCWSDEGLGFLLTDGPLKMKNELVSYEELCERVSK